MRKFNYFKAFLKIYKFMPKWMQFCVCSVVRRTHGQGWYGIFALKSVLHKVENMTEEEYKYYETADRMEKIMTDKIEERDKGGKELNQEEINSIIDNTVDKYIGLCHRCEHRVRHLENNSYQPRYECGQSFAVHSCYMYIPVKPIIIEPDEGETRLILTGWAFSGRYHGVVISENIELSLEKEDKGFLLYWRKCANHK